MKRGTGGDLPTGSLQIKGCFGLALERRQLEMGMNGRLLELTLETNKCKYSTLSSGFQQTPQTEDTHD